MNTKQVLKRALGGVFALALAMACVVSLPVQARAAEDVVHSIFSIDAGRKYFSADQLKQIIDHAAKNGYTDVQLILANDGMRFFLDDMSVSANGQSYESDAVKAALTAGNNSYYKDPNGNALTETEMDDIISYAKSKGIGIVPVINSPGHMDALLVAMKELGIQNAAYANGSKVSKRTVDITNDEAVNFLYAVLQKYISYFGEAGVSEYFNFGADEFANDVFTNPGWGEIQSNGTYRNFVEYANHVSGLIKAAGMKPVCFNDGIYYNRKTNFGTFDQDLTVSYWTSGWWGFNVAKPEFLQQQGLDILNTNDAWYWVLGHIDSGGYPFNNAVKNIASKGFNEVTGASGEIPTIGSMQCVWCDEPSKPHDMNRIFELMDKFSAKHEQFMPKPAADYSKVDEWLAAVPGDLSIYTDETAQAVKDAVAAVKRGYKADQQAEVDKMAADLEQAVRALAKRDADYSKVDAALKTVPADLSIYTDETAQAVKDAVAAVKRGYKADKQAEVDKMAADIEAAVKALAKKPAPKPEQKPTTKPSALPQTGDPAMVATVLCASAGALGVGITLRRRNKDVA